MNPVVMVAGLAGVFVLSHLLLANRVLRKVLVTRLGHSGFAALFSLVAWGSLGSCIVVYANNAHVGGAGLGLAHSAAARWLAFGLVAAGLGFLTTLFSPRGYVDAPAVPFVRRIGPAYGLQRVTRHPMFVGMTLFACGHLLMAERTIGVVLFGILACLGVVGAWHQDKKLCARRGTEYIEFCHSTSALPFAAIVKGRQTLVLRELPWILFVLGGVGGVGVYRLHSTQFGYGTIGSLLLMVVVPVGLTVWSAKRQRARRQK